MGLVKDLGCRLSIDDFCTIPSEPPVSGALQFGTDGTHSHIHYLATLPATELKIDLSCARLLSRVPGHRIEKILHWICSLPATFPETHVVIEGIDSTFPLSFLHRYHGNPHVLFQGFKYGKPMEMSTLDTWLATISGA